MVENEKQKRKMGWKDEIIPKVGLCNRSSLLKCFKKFLTLSTSVLITNFPTF